MVVLLVRQKKTIKLLIWKPLLLEKAHQIHQKKVFISIDTTVLKKQNMKQTVLRNAKKRNFLTRAHIFANHVVILKKNTGRTFSEW